MKTSFFDLITQFDAAFNTRIRNLIKTYPEDAKITVRSICTQVSLTQDNGVSSPFWSGTKRFPSVAVLSLSEPLHCEFLFTSSNMYAALLQIPQIPDRETFLLKLQEYIGSSKSRSAVLSYESYFLKI